MEDEDKRNSVSGQPGYRVRPCFKNNLITVCVYMYARSGIALANLFSPSTAIRGWNSGLSTRLVHKHFYQLSHLTTAVFGNIPPKLLT